MTKTSAEFHKLSHAHHEQRISAHKEAMDGEHKDSARHAFHKSSIAHHEPLRDFHKAAMEKAASGEMNKSADISATVENAVAAYFEKISNKLIPSLVSAVTPSRPGITAVPRAGQQTIPE